MCGVIGYVPPVESRPADELKDAFRRLMLESRVRGTHAYGLAQEGRVVKSTIDQIVKVFDPTIPAIAHARYSTSGDWTVPENNQPIVVGQTALAFNGVIDMGTKDEFEARWGVKCDTANDGELFLRRQTSAESFVRGMSGSFAGVWIEWTGPTKRDTKTVLRAIRNERRPLWFSWHLGAAWYASTEDIMRRSRFETPMEIRPLELMEHVWS